MYWLNEPGTWNAAKGEELESQGSWKIFEDDQKLSLRPDSKKDFWQKTYYKPLLIKDDGPCYLRKVPAGMELTMEVFFTITPFRQFDQAGLMVRFDETHWLKTGIEVVDGIPRLSCVVTNGHSDWSTQKWEELSCRLRVTQKGDGAYVVEAHMSASQEQSTSESGFNFIRIA